MPNHKYDKEAVLVLIADYFFQHPLEELALQSFEKVYANIVEFAHTKSDKIKMPKAAQARSLIISELTEYNLYENGERFTSQTAYKLKKIYYASDDIDSVLRNEYKLSIFSGEIIICTINLPSEEILQMLTEGISGEKGKSKQWGKINTIRKICKRIKERDPDNILAVIPECNRMVYLNCKGKIDNNMSNLDPLCSSLCMFVKNTPTGQALVESLRSDIIAKKISATFGD